MRFSAILILLISPACSFQNVAQATDIPTQQQIKKFERRTKLPCSISLEVIPDPRLPYVDDSRYWVKATTPDCGENTINWSINNGGYIEAWHRDETGKTAWLAGIKGTYQVTAEIAGATAKISIFVEPEA